MDLSVLRKTIFLLLVLLLIVPVQAEELLLVDLEIPEGYQQLNQQESVLVETQIILVGRNQTDKLTDVLIEYSIKNKEDDTIIKLSETKGGVVRIQAVKELHLPAELLPGIYSVAVRASYKNVSAENSASFEVTKMLVEIEAFSQPTTRNLLLTIIVGMITLFLFSAYQFWKIERIHRGW